MAVFSSADPPTLVLVPHKQPFSGSGSEAGLASLASADISRPCGPAPAEPTGIGSASDPLLRCAGAAASVPDVCVSVCGLPPPRCPGLLNLQQKSPKGRRLAPEPHPEVDHLGSRRLPLAAFHIHTGRSGGDVLQPLKPSNLHQQQRSAGLELVPQLLDESFLWTTQL